MPYIIRDLLSGHAEPLCVKQDVTIQKALGSMLDQNYSQLPVVDHDNKLTGIISKEIITNKLLFLKGASYLLDLTVDHCMVPAITRYPDVPLDDDVLADFQDNECIIITDANKLVIGILTNYDIMQFFRMEATEQLIVRDIELTLRDYIEAIIPSEREREMAIAQIRETINPDNGHKYSLPPYKEMTLGQYLIFIKHSSQWSKFEHYFGPMTIFEDQMKNILKIRNTLMHFRDLEITYATDILRNVQIWLTNRPPRPQLKNISAAAIATFTITKPVHTMKSRIGKYDPLINYLITQPADISFAKLSFQNINEILGDELPPSAYKHRAWWSNDSVGHLYSIAWINAGWRVQYINLGSQEVVFERASTKTSKEEK